MPSIKDFKGKPSDPSSDAEGSASAASHKRAKRRPGRDEMGEIVVEPSQDEVKVVDVETGEHVNASGTATSQQGSSADQEPENKSEKDSELDLSKVKISFPGSDLVRSTFPKSFDLAEKVATEWIHDGRFDDLSSGYPLADHFVGKGLRRAKDIEKKIINSPVTEKVIMKAFEAGMKTHTAVNEFKSKVQDIRRKVQKK